MASLRGQNVAVPLRTPCLSDVWITYSAQGRRKSNAIARLRPVPQTRHPYPDLSYLAHAVIGQACKDACPEKCPKMKAEYIVRLSKSRLQAQYMALAWLCSDDPDLRYWAVIADYPMHAIHHEYRPLLIKFIEAHPDVAARYDPPKWVRACA